MPRLRPALGLLTAALALLLAAAAAAQQTGSIVFELTDAAGNPLPGATILVDSERLPGTQLGTTDRHGRAHFPVLPPGDYTAEVSLEGYLTLRKTVALGLGAASVERVLMARGTMTEEVSVVGAKPIDTTETGTTHVFTERVIQAVQIGSGDRAYQNVLQNAPGVGGGGNPAVRGATLGENRYLIDGVDTSDPVTGTFGLNSNFDALEQVQFVTGGFDAAHGLATGGMVNLITKSGGNTHDGAVDIRWHDEGLIESSANFPNELPQEFRLAEVNVGGPIIKDKLWYFLSVSDILNEEAIAGSTTPRTFDGSYYLAKVTWQLNPNHRLAFQYMADPAEVTADNGGSDTAPEALDFQEQGADFFKINYWGRLSDRWSLSILAGDYNSKLNTTPLRDTGLPSRIDDHTNFLSQNYNDAQFSDRLRRQYAWDAAYTTPNKRFHVITFGMDLIKPSFQFERRQPGGREEHVSSDPDSPFPVDRVQYYVELEPAGQATDEGEVVAWFLQDKWHVTPRVTLRGGMRYENVQFNRDDKTRVLDVSKWQPRFGAAFDVKGDGKQKVDFSASRSLHPAILTVANSVNARGDRSVFYCDEEVFGADFDGDTVVTGGDFGECFSFGGPSGGSIQPGIKPTYEDELEVGYTYALRDNMILGARVSVSHTYDLMEDTIFPVDDDPNNDTYQVQNIPGLQRRYKGLEISYAWDARRWHVFGNWTISEAKGNVEYTQHLGTDFDVLPEHGINRFGFLGTDARHRLKIQSWVDLPRNWQVASNLRWRSGLAYNHFENIVPYGELFLEPRGSRRTESLRNMDAEVRKKFTFGTDDMGLVLIGSINNLFHETTPASRSGLDDAVLTRQAPRTYELGLRFEF